jgi:hypothetical protein
MMAAAKKQTAANNAFLRDAKDAMNGPIYRKAAAILNAEGEGAARAYVAGFFRPGTDLDATLAEMAATVRAIRASR